MTGIYDCFGYGSGYDVSFEERYKLIRKSGFDCVMLWWSNQFGRGDGYQEDVRLARRVGLFVESIHVPVHEQNNLSLDNLSGEGVFQSYLQCVADCCEYDIPTMVIHLPNDNNPLNQTGIRRLAELINKAEQKNIQIAFENLSNIKNLKVVLNKFTSNNVGYCYDSCHHINYAPDEDLLGMYGNRLMAIHLQDNGGSHNQHQLPFDGNIKWDTVMEKIACTGYWGATTLEPMNWDYSHLNICQFLELAYERAKRLDYLLILRVWEITPNKKNCILCVQMHCLLSCEYRNEIKFEFRKKAKKRMPIIKLYTGLALRRLKKISNIKPFSSLFFRFYGFEWNMVQLGTV